MQGKKDNIIEGDRFGMLTIIKEIFGRSRRSFLCKCDCGNEHISFITALKNKKNKSCGCYNIKSKTKHGQSNNRIYKIRQGIKDRCDNTNNQDYNYYGGLGISYDKTRSDFERFYNDMIEGYSDELTIDRINPYGNYCKENCRWSTRLEQSKNQRRNTIITQYSKK